jgi:predicted nucleotidyltransferase
LNAVLGSVTKVKLLRALLPLSRPVGLREAARLADVSPSAAQGAMEELTAMGVLDLREATSQHLYQINRKNRLAKALQELFDAEDQRRVELLEAIRGELQRFWGPAVESVTIFGSSARGDDAPDSDLDLLVVTETEEDEEDTWERLLEKAPMFLREFGVRISPVVMSLEQLRERAEDGDPLIAAVVKEGIPVVKPTIEKLLR